MPARTGTAPTVKYYWAEPEPELASQQMLELSYGLEEFEEPLLAASALIQADIKMRFKTGTDPSGRAWDDWSKSYRNRRAKKGQGRTFADRASLNLTGELEREVTSADNWRIAQDALFLDTSDLPPYWAWNNFGAERSIPAHGESAEGEAEFRARAKALGMEVVGSTQNYLPERPFVGVSLAAREKITQVFDAWFIGEVEFARSPKGKPFFRHSKRGPGGRFVRR